jgi:hypothetical protein
MEGKGFVTYGGQAGTVFNDMRRLDYNTLEWSVIKKDENTRDVQGRFGHVCGAFGRYLVVFGGYGEKDLQRHP